MSIFRRVKRSRRRQLADYKAPTIDPPPLSRSWRAGEWDDLTADWMISPQWSYSLVQRHLSVLRARARSESRSNDYAKRAIGMLKNGIVGPDGFQLQCSFQDPRGADTVANRAFEKHWREWADRPANVDTRGRNTLTELCHQLVHQLCTDGELFIRRWLRGPMGIQLQVIEPLLVDLTYHDELRNGNLVRFGIEIDRAFGRPVAYYVNQGQPFDLPYPTGERERVPASEMYHVFIAEGVDQLRGFPWLSTPMYRMHMLDGYEEAAAVNARASANKMGWIQTREPERYAGEANGQPAVEEINGVSIGYLGEHQEWRSHDPTYPSGEFKDYVQQMLRGISSGLELSYPTLANDLAGVNYNSLRHDALQERDVYMRLQRWFKDHLLHPIYEDWLDVRLADGIPIPRAGGGFRAASAANRAKYREVKFQGRRWQWVDPLKEIQAAAQAVALGVTTREQIIRDQGRDPEEVLEAVRNERDEFGTVENGAQPDSRPDDRAAGDDPAEGDQRGTEDG